jgi:hypothetical protein
LGMAAEISVRALVFQSGDAIGEVYAHDPAAADSPPFKLALKGYLNHEFTELSLRGRSIRFTAGSDRNSANLGECTVPADALSVILVFLPASASDDKPFHIMAVEDSAKSFPAGSFLVTNLSKVPVRLMLEKKGYEIAAGKRKLINNPPVRTGNLSGMNAFAFLEDGWKRIGSGVWPHPGKSRVLQILFRDSGTGLVQLRAFDDVPLRITEIAAAR